MWDTDGSGEHTAVQDQGEPRLVSCVQLYQHLTDSGCPAHLGCHTPVPPE